MSFLEYNIKTAPTGLRKVLYINWALVILVTAISAAGFLMLYSVAGGNADTWAEPQLKRFIAGMGVMFFIAFVPIWFWRNMAGLAYLASVALLVAVELFGTVGMGAQRWIEIGPLRLQPSELTKITLIWLLASYYDWLDVKKTSRPLWVIVPIIFTMIPTALVLKQPDLGTSIQLIAGAAAVMLCAGVSLYYFGAVLLLIGATVTAVFTTRGTPWQFLQDYQYRRIDTFLDPSADPLGAGYHINQAKIALGSGGVSGRGFMQGTQSRLNFLPEKHTDFIFNTLAEEFGFIGGMSLLTLYTLVLVFCIAAAMKMRDRFSALITLGVAATFFLYFAVNMLMVMGLAPVVGAPLPLVSYGGSSMLVLLAAFGLVQSANVHRLR